MKIYYCKCCDYTTGNKTKYDRHCNTLKHNRLTKSKQKVNKKSTFSQQKVNIFECEYCQKSFTTKQSMYRHIKYTCKENKDEDLKELVRLMNEKMDEQNRKIESMEQALFHKDKQIEKRDKQISKLSNKLQINHIQNIQQNNIHFHLNSYKNTDLSILDDTDFYDCLKKYKNCVVKAIEKIHLNPQHPQNMNLYISNIKENYIMMYDDDRWVLRDRNKELFKIYEEKEEILDEWVDSNKHFKPELMKMFKRYLELKDDDENLIKELIKDVKMMIYNNREKINYFESVDSDIHKNILENEIYCIDDGGSDNSENK